MKEKEEIKVLWVSCFTCIFSKLFDVPDPQADYFKCTHGWHRNMKGTYQRMHSMRKCKQHKLTTVRLIKCKDCNKCIIKQDRFSYDCIDEFFKAKNKTYEQLRAWRSCSAFEFKKEIKKK